MTRFIRVCMIVYCVVGFCGVGHTAEVTLKSGKVFVGGITKYDDDEFSIQTEKGVFGVPYKMVDQFDAKDSTDEKILAVQERLKTGKKRKFVSSGRASKDYHTNGQLKSIKSISNKTLHGQYALYDVDGSLLINLVMRDGLIQEIVEDNLFKELSGDDVPKWEDSVHFRSIIRYLFSARKYSVLEKLIERYRLTKPVNTNGYPLAAVFYSALRERFGDVKVNNRNEFFSRLDEWKEQFPSSVAQYILRARAYDALGWLYRGGGYSDTVSDSGADRFRASMLSAARVIRVADQLEQKDPRLELLKIRNALYTNKSKREILAIFEQAKLVDPTNYPYYRIVCVALLPRWGGARGQLEKFIIDSTSGLAEQDRFTLSALMYDKVASYVGKTFFTKFKWDYEHIKKSYEFYVESYPSNSYMLNRLAWFAVNYKDKVTALKYIRLCEHRYDSSVWRTKDEFNEARKWVRSESNTPLRPSIYQFIVDNSLVKVQEYVKQGKDLNLRDGSLNTPLHLAIMERRSMLARILIAGGADLSILNNYDESPLILAARYNATGLTRILLKKGSLANARSKYNSTALHHAGHSGNVYIGRSLLEQDDSILNFKNKSNATAFENACKGGKAEFIRMLLEWPKLEVEYKDGGGDTCMHNAVESGSLDIVEILLNLDYDFISQKNNKGQTPLDLATNYDELRILSRLKKHLNQKN